MRGKHLIKVLGLSLLVAVGAMAVSASAAQAKWLLLKNGASVDTLSLVGTVLLGELLVDKLGLKIHCPEGTIAAEFKLSADKTKATGTGSATFKKCTVLTFPKCTVNSPGAAAGEIKAAGSGEGKMTGETVFAELSSAEFTTIEITGALCSISELGGQKVNGTATLTLHEPLVDKKEHLALLDELALFYGKENAIIHGELLTPGVLDPAVLVHATEASGATFAVHLVEL